MQSNYPLKVHNLSKRLERHGGKIWVELELGKGSQFKLTIPKNENIQKHN